MSPVTEKEVGHGDQVESRGVHGITVLVSIVAIGADAGTSFDDIRAEATAETERFSANRRACGTVGLAISKDGPFARVGMARAARWSLLISDHRPGFSGRQRPPASRATPPATPRVARAMRA